MHNRCNYKRIFANSSISRIQQQSNPHWASDYALQKHFRQAIYKEARRVHASYARPQQNIGSHSSKTAHYIADALSRYPVFQPEADHIPTEDAIVCLNTTAVNTIQCITGAITKYYHVWLSFICLVGGPTSVVFSGSLELELPILLNQT